MPDIDKSLVEKEVGSKIINEIEQDDGTVFSFKNGQDWLVLPDFDDARMSALNKVKQDLEEEPELFSQDWLSGFVDEESARVDIELTINNDSGYYEQFKEEENPKTDEEFDRFSEWTEERTKQIIKDDDFEESGFNKMDYINIRKASEGAVDIDGVAHFLSGYDGKEVELDNGNVMYRLN